MVTPPTFFTADLTNAALHGALIDADAASRVVASLPASPALREQLTAQATSAAITAMAAQDGIAVPAEALAALIVRDPAGLTTPIEPGLREAACLLRALAYVDNTLARTPSTPLSVAFARRLHELATQGDPAREARPGQLISDTGADDLRDLVRFLNRAPANAWHPIVQASAVHAGILAVRPFAAGNGRTAALASAFTLRRGGIRGIGPLTLAGVAERDPRGFDRLATSAASGGDVTALAAFCANGLSAILDAPRRALLSEAERVAFHDHARSVVAAAPGLRAPSRARLLEFVLLLEPAGAALATIRNGPHALRALHARLSGRTLQRDLDDLRAFDLIAIEDGVVRPRMERVRGG